MGNVAIVSNSLSGGGAEYSCELIHQELKQRNVPVFWIGINSENPRHIRVNESVLCLNRDKQKGMVHTFLIYCQFVRLLYQLDITQIITNCELPELLSCFIPKKIRLVVVEHANPTWYNRDILGYIVRTLLKFRGSIFVTVGDHLSPRYAQKQKTVHIPNPVPSVELTFVSSPTRNLRRLIYVGRLSRDFKNPQLVLQIGKHAHVKTVFVGTGPLLSELKQVAAELGVEAHFCGFKELPWEIYEDGDLLIIPSYAEGDGLVLIEAIARGIPFLATDIPDLNRYGINANNYCSNLEAFLKQIEVFRHRIGELVVPKEIVSRIYSKRNIEVVGQQWYNLINQE